MTRFDVRVMRSVAAVLGALALVPSPAAAEPAPRDWEAPRQLTGEPRLSADTVLTVAGTSVATWEGARSCAPAAAAVRRPGEDSWSISRRGRVDEGTTRLVTGADDRVARAWVSCPTAAASVQRLGAAGWGATRSVEMPPGLTFTHQAAMNDRGTIAMAWAQQVAGSPIGVAVFPLRADPVVLPSLDVGYASPWLRHLAVHNDGTVEIVTVDYDASAYERMDVSTYRDGAWSTTQIPQDPDVVIRNVAFASATSGQLAVLWVEHGSDGINPLMVTTRDAGGSFSTPYVLSPDRPCPESAYYLCADLDLTRGGDVTALWTTGIDASPDFQIARRSGEDGSWTSPELLVAADQADSPQIDAQVDGSALAVLDFYGRGSVYSCKSATRCRQVGYPAGPTYGVFAAGVGGSASAFLGNLRCGKEDCYIDTLSGSLLSPARPSRPSAG